jgi:type II secretory pathway pseudopilin PulG
MKPAHNGMNPSPQGASSHSPGQVRQLPDAAPGLGCKAFLPCRGSIPSRPDLAPSTPPRPRHWHAYTLVEVLIAGALLAIGVAAAAVLARTIYANQESSALATRALNVQEQAGRLFSLGLATNTITNLLPESCTNVTTPPAGRINLQFALATNTITNVGDIEAATIQIIFPSATDSAGTLLRRTNTVLVVRPTIR